MNRCPITYELCGNKKYSERGLSLLSPRLDRLLDFPYGANEQLELMLEASDKLSFSGVQPKFSARLSSKKQIFEPVSKAGTFIIKPQSARFPELPEIEDLTMKLARLVGIETPLHGLIYCKDGSMSYFIKRFDRKGKGEKIPVEDFAQLAELPNETKYDSSMEKIASLVEKFCTFPAIEKQKLFLLTLFSFLVGNEDLHLKNLSLITQDQITKFTPAYDLVNSTILMNTKEELALPLNGKKSRFTLQDFTQYYGMERLKLSQKTIEDAISVFKAALFPCRELIQASFLSSEKKKLYLKLIESRLARLGL